MLIRNLSLEGGRKQIIYKNTDTSNNCWQRNLLDRLVRPPGSSKVRGVFFRPEGAGTLAYLRTRPKEMGSLVVVLVEVVDLDWMD